MDKAFTPFERLNLYNQYTILEKLSILQDETEDAKDYALKARIIKEGFSYSYHECLEIIQDELPIEECKLVWDTLEMYSAILSSYKKIENPKVQIDDIFFYGFDGNNEPDLLSYCEFILNDLNRYDELTADGRKNFNSHSHCRDKYREMICKWDEMKRPFPLTEAQIINLIK